MLFHGLSRCRGSQALKRRCPPAQHLSCLLSCQSSLIFRQMVEDLFPGESEYEPQKTVDSGADHFPAMERMGVSLTILFVPRPRPKVRVVT